MTFTMEEFGSGVGYFKAGLYGWAGSGKTHTATLLALGIRKHLKLAGRIGFFDTETGGEYVDPMVLAETGQHIIGRKSRALGDAIQFVRACEEQGVSVAIVDSTTHIWDEVQATYLKALNQQLESKKKPPKSKIEWQDRGPLNDIWQKFTDAYLNSKLHIIICGRAANLWEMTENEDGKKELNKIGTKMKTQSEMAYEPSFLAEMAREQKYDGKSQVIVRTMTVLKDRYRELDGKQFENPTFEDILPHVLKLTSGASNAIDTTRTTEVKVNSDGDAQWTAERRAREILREEIVGKLTVAFPGQGAEEKKARALVIFKLFDTHSWVQVEQFSSDKLRDGLARFDEAVVSATNESKKAVTK